MLEKSTVGSVLVCWLLTEPSGLPDLRSEKPPKSKLAQNFPKYQTSVWHTKIKNAFFTVLAMHCTCMKTPDLATLLYQPQERTLFGTLTHNFTFNKFCYDWLGLLPVVKQFHVCFSFFNRIPVCDSLNLVKVSSCGLGWWEMVGYRTLLNSCGRGLFLCLEVIAGWPCPVQRRVIRWSDR